MTSVQSTSKPLLIALILIGIGVSEHLSAQIYKYRDENGNIVFSDQAPANTPSSEVEQVELGATNSSAPPPEMTRPEPAKPDAESEVSYETVITSPADGSTIPMGPGNFAVTATFAPALKSGERVQLELDGAVIGEPQRGGAWQLTNVFRGEHKLVVRRLDKKGKTLHSSPAVTVYVMRPSIR